ncbi:fasciclin domain-containing protein [Nonlabens ponticola]|nr:fasciclin domain-containing protein [Nonlabens ponticola]
MKIEKSIQKLMFLMVLFVGFVSCDDDDDNNEDRPTTAEVVADENDLSLLELALDAAGLTATLDGEGNFTVFAPTNSAFINLLNELGDDYDSLDDFDEDVEIDLLRNILLYHVVGVDYDSDDLARLDDDDDDELATLFAGNTLDIDVDGDSVQIGDESDVDANVINANIRTSNGVVHKIDKILLPQEAIDFLNSLDDDDDDND